MYTIHYSTLAHRYMYNQTTNLKESIIKYAIFSTNTSLEAIELCKACNVRLKYNMLEV